MARLREIDGDVRRVLYTPEVYRCMPSWARQWSDGGCRTLLRATLAWLGNDAEPFGLFLPVDHWRSDTDPEFACHVGARVAGRFFLDGDGFRNWSEAACGCPDYLELRGFDMDTEHGYVEDPSTVKWDTLYDLIALLVTGLGPRETFLSRLPRA
jgi:hypothetical protein